MGGPAISGSTHGSYLASPIQRRFVRSHYHAIGDVPCGSKRLKAVCHGSDWRSCKKYRNLGTRFPENFQPWQKSFQQKFCSHKEKMILFLQFLAKEKIYLIFLHYRSHLLQKYKVTGFVHINMARILKKP